MWIWHETHLTLKTKDDHCGRWRNRTVSLWMKEKEGFRFPHTRSLVAIIVFKKKKILIGHSGLSGFVLVFFKHVNYDTVSINLKCCQKFSVYVYVRSWETHIPWISGGPCMVWYWILWSKFCGKKTQVRIQNYFLANDFEALNLMSFSTLDCKNKTSYAVSWTLKMEIIM